MNNTDYNYLANEIKKAESYLKFFEGVKDGNYTNEINFWKGYLNAVNLAWLQSKNNYKLV